MSLATDLQNDIAELMDDPDVGRTITLSRTPPGTYNPADGSVADGVLQTWNARGLFLGYEDRLINGSDIKVGDRRLYLKIKNLTYVPEMGDKVVAGADVYMVISFKRVELTGTNIIFILQVRR